uniref:pectinesterase n=1 Tax=Arundo donax TaxID=35708 RepID=A0A0A9G7S6_ARUDO
MAASSPARLLLCVAAVALLVASGGVATGHGQRHTHTKRLRPGKSAAAAAKPYPVNATRVAAIERQFTRWVRFVGGLGHTTFNRALNRALLPTRTLVVDKNPAAGGFTSIQAAVDSLPLINLARVVIKVNAGTYTEKVNISPMRAFITIEGAGADKTVVQWGDTADTVGGTFASATFAVNSAFFVAKNITFKVRRRDSCHLVCNSIVSVVPRHCAEIVVRVA